MNTLIVLVIILIILSVWNLFGYYDLKKFNRSYRELKDDRYYELKYKNEFITASVIVVISVGGFFGYKLFDDAKKTVDNLKVEIDSLGKVLEAKKDTVSYYEVMQTSLDSRIKTAESKINKINDISIIKQDLYLVDKILFTHNPNTNTNIPSTSGTIIPDTLRYYYKNLKNIKGEDLPVFDKPPFLAIVPESGYFYNIVEKTKDYFILEDIGVQLGGIAASENSGQYFGIMVSQR